MMRIVRIICNFSSCLGLRRVLFRIFIWILSPGFSFTFISIVSWFSFFEMYVYSLSHIQSLAFFSLSNSVSNAFGECACFFFVLGSNPHVCFNRYDVFGVRSKRTRALTCALLCKSRTSTRKYMGMKR